MMRNEDMKGTVTAMEGRPSGRDPLHEVLAAGQYIYIYDSAVSSAAPTGLGPEIAVEEQHPTPSERGPLPVGRAATTRHGR